MLTNRDIDDIYPSIHDWIGLDMTDQQIRDFCEKHPGWEKDFHEMGMDTCNREYFAQLIARDLLGRRWPENGDGDEVGEKFFKDFRAAAKAAGYKLS